MPDVLLEAYTIAEKSLIFSTLLFIAVLVFIGFFVGPWLAVRFKVRHLTRHLNALKQSGQLDPRKVEIADRRIAHLWQ